MISARTGPAPARTGIVPGACEEVRAAGSPPPKPARAPPPLAARSTTDAPFPAMGSSCVLCRAHIEPFPCGGAIAAGRLGPDAYNSSAGERRIPQRSPNDLTRRTRGCRCSFAKSGECGSWVPIRGVKQYLAHPDQPLGRIEINRASALYHWRSKEVGKTESGVPDQLPRNRLPPIWRHHIGFRNRSGRGRRPDHLPDSRFRTPFPSPRRRTYCRSCHGKISVRCMVYTIAAWPVEVRAGRDHPV